MQRIPAQQIVRGQRPVRFQIGAKVEEQVLSDVGQRRKIVKGQHVRQLSRDQLGVQPRFRVHHIRAHLLQIGKVAGLVPRVIVLQLHDIAVALRIEVLGQLLPARAVHAHPGQRQSDLAGGFIDHGFASVRFRGRCPGCDWLRGGSCRSRILLPGCPGRTARQQNCSQQEHCKDFLSHHTLLTRKVPRSSLLQYSIYFPGKILIFLNFPEPGHRASPRRKTRRGLVCIIPSGRSRWKGWCRGRSGRA